jgi:hypothetical protein
MAEDLQIRDHATCIDIMPMLPMKGHAESDAGQEAMNQKQRIG